MGLQSLRLVHVHMETGAHRLTVDGESRMCCSSASGAVPVHPGAALCSSHRPSETLAESEGSSGVSLVQPPAEAWCTQHQTSRTVSRRLWSVSNVEDCTTCSESPCQGFVTSQGRCFLTCRENLLCSGLCPWPLVLPLGTTEESQVPSSLHFSSDIYIH